MLMKTLLDFNANTEACGVDGFTPLMHVARGSSATHAMLLLEYGANINATSTSGQKKRRLSQLLFNTTTMPY